MKVRPGYGVGLRPHGERLSGVRRALVWLSRVAVATAVRDGVRALVSGIRGRW